MQCVKLRSDCTQSTTSYVHKKVAKHIAITVLSFHAPNVPAEYFATRAICKNQLDKLLLYKFTESKANTLGYMNK